MFIKILPKKVHTLFITVVLLLTLMFGIKEYTGFLQYEYQTKAAGYHGWQYGTREVVNTIQPIAKNYDKVILTRAVAYLPYLYLRFFDTQKQLPDNLRFGNTACYQDTPHALYIMRPDETATPSTGLQKVIYYPNKRDIAFYIFSYSPKEN